MNRYLLLILLSSWAHVVPLSFQCETGVAYPSHALSVPRSLMANADVAILKTYHTETLDRCITDCCAEKFGRCTVASFKKNIGSNSTEINCQHFNCRPVTKCKYSSSNSTDSFSFSSTSSPHVLVPSSHASKNDSLSSTAETTVTTDASETHKSAQNKQDYAVTEETASAYYEEQLAFKNDNTSIKPRKGVTEEVTESSLENRSRSGVKPRKGVSFDDVLVSNNTRSKVKPRKGVGPYESVASAAATVKPSISHSLSSVKYEPYSTLATEKHAYKDIAADDVVSALEKVFEDDVAVKEEIKPSATSSSESAVVQSTPFTLAVVHSTNPTIHGSAHTSVKISSSSDVQSSFSTSYAVSTPSVHTPDLINATATVDRFPMPSSSSPSISEHSKLLFHEVKVYDEGKSAEREEQFEDSAESESERKYKSSMHLVLSLVFGLLVLFSVLGVVAKRVYDSWMRRHYRRMDFLIDGMYDGYG